MRYKIEYGPDDKYDRLGHLKKAAPVYTDYADTNIEGETKALKISAQHKKWTVSLFDTCGPIEDPEDSNSTLWLICSYKGGKRICTNNNYTHALNYK